MMLYKNTKVNVYSPDVDTDFFDVVACVLQGDNFGLYLFIICLDNVLRISIDLMKKMADDTLHFIYIYIKTRVIRKF